jgi:nicotinamidase-related amidase
LRPISPCDSAAQRSRWAQSGFANTDLDFQLKQHGVSHIIAVGLLANTCIESPGRFAMDFGYHVTLVRDATAAFSHEMMHATHHLNGPTGPTRSWRSRYRSRMASHAFRTVRASDSRGDRKL